MLSDEVYSNLEVYIEKGKIILDNLIKLYEEIDGLTEEQNITDEIKRIIIF